MSSSAGESGQGQGEDAATAAGRKSDLEPGTLVNGIYRLVRLLGMGGMGEVWEARHERTKGRVALKLLLPEMGRHQDVLARFQREVEITSGLNHPNIVRVSDADKLPNGRPFLVMEFLDGRDLAKLTGRPIAFADVADIVEQVAMGLHAAHGQSVIHRDLKPANLFVVLLPGTSRTLIKILDFGISKALDGLSKLTQTHSVLGTPYYMAPEQARGGTSSMDGRADQFSLAAIAYELLTGRMAFEGDGTMNVIYKVVLEQPPTFASWGLSLPPEVEAVVLRGLSKAPDARFGSVLEFSEALKAAGGAGTGEKHGTAHGGSGPTLASGPAAEVPLVGFLAPGGTLATPRGGLAPPRGPALVTPRTLRMPGDPGTTLGASTGELAVAAPPNRDARGEDATSGTGARRTRLGLVVGGAGVAAVVVAIVAIMALRGSPQKPERPGAAAVGPPSAAPAELASAPVERAVAPSAAVAPSVPAPVPVPPAAKIAAAPPEPGVAPPSPATPAPSVPVSTPPPRGKLAGAKAIPRAGTSTPPHPTRDAPAARSNPVAATPARDVLPWRDPFADDAATGADKGKGRGIPKVPSSEAPAAPPRAKASAGKTVRNPGPVNSDL